MKLGPDRKPPLARFEGNRVLIAGEASEWLTIVGIALEAKAGSKLTLVIEHAGREPSTVKVAIGPKEYATQRLTVKPGQGRAAWFA